MRQRLCRSSDGLAGKNPPFSSAVLKRLLSIGCLNGLKKLLALNVNCRSSDLPGLQAREQIVEPIWTRLARGVDIWVPQMLVKKGGDPKKL
ncbi:unnamed protein product [Nippostrongylus brasiliensis]|uniref:Uncharacterized protein n=1 Tax=Nippostrongylus brasiliensis TaxID=27835 RepID=A0A0N4YG54_NIPBR|nr:unnamed protein product [Nippostrongylus brasiliensis]